MLQALVLSLALLLGRGRPSPAVVDAIVSGCTEEAVEHPVDVRACVALVSVYAAHESSWRTGVYGDGGRSYGLLQGHAAVMRGQSTAGQVRTWLRWLRESSLASVDSSPSRAARRERLAARLLDAVEMGAE